MGPRIELTKGNSVFTSGDKVAGHVELSSHRSQDINALNISFVGRLQVEIKSKNPRFRSSNIAQKNLFRYVQKLWEGATLSMGTHAWKYEFAIPDSDHLLPSCSDAETSTLSTTTCKGDVEYFLELSILGADAPKHIERKKLKFIGPRRIWKPEHVPQKSLTEFVCQSPRLSIAEDKSSFRKMFGVSSASDPKIHFQVNFVHSTEAIAGDKVHLFLDLSQDIAKTTALMIPPVHLHHLKLLLIGEHVWRTSQTVDELNGLPTSFRTSSFSQIMDTKNVSWGRDVLIYDKIDLRPHYKQFRIPAWILPTVESEYLSVSYRFEIHAEFECLGKIFKQDPIMTNQIKILASLISPELQVERFIASNDDGKNAAEDIVGNTKCPVCDKNLASIPESERQLHVDACLITATSVQLPESPRSVLVVDDYYDFTSPIAEACLNDLRKTNELFAKCIGRVVWAEHEQVDILEHSFSQDELKKLLHGQGLAWARLPTRVYWEIEKLRAYDYIIYAGQDFSSARAKLAVAPLPEYSLIKNTLIINMESLIPPNDWPHDHRDLETAWTRADVSATPEVRLQRQYQVIRDCCIDFAWQYFKLKLPGFKDEGRVDGLREMPGIIPTELPVPPKLPPELPGFVDPKELPASLNRDSTRRPRNVSADIDHDEELYSNPAMSTESKAPKPAFPGMSYRSGPSEIYELP